MTTQSLSLRLADDLAKNPVTWPGLHPRYGLTNDGQALCPDCCRAERSLIGTTAGPDGWCLVDASVDWGDAEDPNGSSEAPTVEERNFPLAQIQ